MTDTPLPPNLAAQPELDTWIRVDAADTVTVFTGKVELGQGIVSAIARIAAEELDLSIDEADVGQVHEGQTAQFSVDAWPGRTFPGRVRQVRYAAHTVAGVVTYEAILAVQNPDLLLRPGMTATAEIEVKRDDQVLLVPNAALRFEPDGHGPAHAGGLSALVSGKHTFDVSRGPDAAPRVWALRHGILEPHDIEAGPSDGTWTEIAAGPVAPGTPLVVSAEGRRNS